MGGTIVMDNQRLALELERLAVRIPGIRGAKVDMAGGAITAVRVLVLPERDPEATVSAFISAARSELQRTIDRTSVTVLRATATYPERPRRRRLGSLMTERLGSQFKTRVTLELPGDVLIGEIEAPTGEMFERRAVSAAVLHGLTDLLDFRVEVESVDLMSRGDERIAVVFLVRDGDRLVGTAIVRSHDHDAIARATLDALNRFVGHSLSSEVA